MARSRLSLKRTLLVSTFAAVSLLSAAAMAADSTTTAATNAAATTAATTGKSGTTTTAANAGTTGTAKASSSDDDTTSAAESKTTTKADTTTATGTKGTTGGTTTLPTISSSGTTATTTGTKASMPTLTSTTDTSIPTYPAPSVPPTQNAPFMQHSHYPDGTVFIAVGSILGAFGLAVLVWRGVVAYLLHRSIARAAMAQHIANDKAAFPVAPAAFYKYSDRNSVMSPGGGGGGGLGGSGGAASGRGVRRTNRGPTPSSTPSQTNLFFSPTAPGASGISPAGAPSNRDSRLLPSGFYAAGSSSPAGGASHGPSISMSNLNLRPDSAGPSRGVVGPSPPDSPAFDPRTSPLGHNTSGSSLNLNRPPSGRAPSAFLDDLLDDQPHLFPPAGGPPHNHSYHSSQGGRM